MKISKIKQVLNSVPKKTAAVLGIAAAVLVPLSLSAWGPSRSTFTMEKPASYVTFNSITDNPGWGDERNFLTVREDQKDTTWANEVNVEDGKTYAVRLYVHNNAASNLNLVSTNTRAAIGLKSKSDQWLTYREINGYIMSDNANPNKIWDKVILRSDKEFQVKVVSAKYYNNVKTYSTGGFDLGDELYTANGALLGYEQMDGKIPGCLAYSGYVLVKFEPVFKENPSYDLEKTVDKTAANAGDTINYTISVKNTGDTELTNVKVSDTLPAYYSNATETVTATGAVSGSIVKDGSLTIDKLAVGETATIKIAYTVKSDLDCGETKITNKATATTDQDTTEDSDDNNEVTTTVTTDCQPGYDVAKTVDKTSAKPGDTITYTITATNTGKVDLTNVKLTDTLPEYYAEASEKVDAPSDISGSIVKGGEVTISKLPVGKSATITIAYKLKDSDKFDCGDTKVTNKVTSTTDQDQTEDKDDNNEVTTTVTKTCEPEKKKTPGYDLVKTVDKTSANPGDTLTYTLTFTNTGEVDLSNVVIKDALPENLTLTSEVKTEPSDGVSGDLFGDGLTIKSVKVGESVKITFSAKLADSDKFSCGETKVTNTATSTTEEDDSEDKTDNNSATTTVSKTCTPDTPTPSTPSNNTTTTTTTTTNTPTTIAQTGAGDVAATVMGLAGISGATTAYIRSRKYRK